MNPSNIQGQIPRQMSGQGPNDGQNYIRQGIPQQIHGLPQQYFGHQYPNHQFTPQQQQQQQQHPFHQYNVNPQYGGQHMLQSQNLQSNNPYQPQNNVFQQQVSRFQDRPINQQHPMKDDQQLHNAHFRGTNFIPGPNDRTFPGSQKLHSDPNRHINFQQQQIDNKVISHHPPQYHEQRINNKRYEPINQPHPLPPQMYYINQKKADVQERTVFEGKRESLDNLSEEDKRKLSITKNSQSNANDYQKGSGGPQFGSNINEEVKNLQKIPNQLGSIQYPVMAPNNQIHHVMVRREEIDLEYEKAIKKLKENKQKIKLLLERQQMDGEITDCKEKIDKLERIIHSKEKVSLNLINKFINVTDAKIKDENLCKPVIDAFDNIVKSGSNYKIFQIPHYDPFQVIKKKLGEPDYVKYTRPVNDSNPLPYYLRKKESEDEEVDKKMIEKEDKVVNKINIENYQYEVINAIDEKTTLIIGKDGKEHLVILTGNDKYLMLSEVVTKDLKLCTGNFKIDPENIPISEHCREINVIITFNEIFIPPLYLLIPVEYPKEICTIINPSFNEKNINSYLCKIISKVEQALPYHSNHRDIKNIVKTWMDLAMTV
uniref:Mediator complex subunit 15 n=1 Tax=Strongyloides stercoralis TaxID=6248 RepID=A0A0K0E6Z9_STRER